MYCILMVNMQQAYKLSSCDVCGFTKENCLEKHYGSTLTLGSNMIILAVHLCLTTVLKMLCCWIFFYMDTLHSKIMKVAFSFG